MSELITDIPPTFELPGREPRLYQELAQRAFDGLDVRLHWEVGTINTAVEVLDGRTGSHFIVDTPGGISPNEVFMHPFAYLANENGPSA